MSSYRSQRISDIQNEPCTMLLPTEGYEQFPLLPFDACVDPLEVLIPNIARNAWIAGERTDANPSDELTHEESAAIHLYTMEWQPSEQSLYFHLNTALRSPDRNALVPYFGYLKLILSGLRKLQSVKGTVWCGVKADVSLQYSVGKTFVWWGFSSCTDSLTLLESDMFLGNSGIRTLFSIECESGKQIRQHSYFQHENEILLLPATQFEVLSKTNPTAGLHIIHLKETKSPFSHFTTSIEATNMNSTLKLTDRVSSSSQIYPNSKLEYLIQQKANLPFAEFRERELNDEDACLIACELAINRHWLDLSISENNIGPVGAASLSKALLSTSTLQRLRLNNNKLGDEGIEHIATSLQTNKTLEELFVADNQISDIGAMKLSTMLKNNKSLKHIDLRQNKIGDIGMASLIAGLKLNTALQYLNLCCNSITDQSADGILDLFSHTKTGLFLDLFRNPFSGKTAFELSKAAKQSCAYVRIN